jgi:hypothetical protein
MFTCSAMPLTANNFHTQFDKLLQCFLQFCSLLAILISLRQWHFLFPQKMCQLLVNCCFLHSIIPGFTSTLAEFNKKFSVLTTAHNNRCYSERDCNRSTTELWNSWYANVTKPYWGLFLLWLGEKRLWLTFGNDQVKYCLILDRDDIVIHLNWMNSIVGCLVWFIMFHVNLRSSGNQVICHSCVICRYSVMFNEINAVEKRTGDKVLM